MLANSWRQIQFCFHSCQLFRQLFWVGENVWCNFSMCNLVSQDPLSSSSEKLEPENKFELCGSLSCENTRLLTFWSLSTRVCQQKCEGAFNFVYKFGLSNLQEWNLWLFLAVQISTGTLWDQAVTLGCFCSFSIGMGSINVLCGTCWCESFLYWVGWDVINVSWQIKFGQMIVDSGCRSKNCLIDMRQSRSG